jgi:hypothetical protein
VLSFTRIRLTVKEAQSGPGGTAVLQMTLA